MCFIFLVARRTFRPDDPHEPHGRHAGAELRNEAGRRRLPREESVGARLLRCALLQVFSAYLRLHGTVVLLYVIL